MRPHWARGVVVLAATGAVLGSLLDGIHTHTGVTAYTHPVFWRMAWWTPLIFAGAYAAGVSRPYLERRLGRPRPAPSLAIVLLGMGLFIAAYALSGVDWPWTTRAAILTTVFAVAWLACDRTLLGLGISLAVAVLGPLSESALVHAGTFVHLRPVYLGVSGWLPCLYLTAGIGLQGRGKWLVDG